MHAFTCKHRQASACLAHVDAQPYEIPTISHAEARRAQEQASAQLMPDGGEGDENSEGGLQAEMMAVVDARMSYIDAEETDPLLHEYATTLAGFNRPHPHNDAAMAAAAAVEAELESAPLSQQVRHKFSQCKMAGVERLGIEAFRRLWALLSRAYPAPDDLSVAEVAENQCAAGQALVLQSCVRLPSRLKLLDLLWRHVFATLRSPAASVHSASKRNADSDNADSQGLGSPEQSSQALPETTPRGSQLMVKVEGRHGCGASVLLAQAAQRVERECGALGLEGGCHVVYFRALPAHTRSYLLWYLCSAVSMATAVRPSWRALSDLLIRRSLDQGMATIFVLDGVTPTDAQRLSETLAATKQAGGMALAILALQSVLEVQQNPLLGQLSPTPIPGAAAPGLGAPPPAAAAPPPLPPLACVEMSVGELPPMETRMLVHATLATLAAGGAGADGGAGAVEFSARGGGRSVVPAAYVDMCEDKILHTLERLQHSRAACAGLPLYVSGVCVLALLRGPSAVAALPPDVCLLWQDLVLPALEERHGRQQIMWLLLALHYEPAGLLPSQICPHERVGAGAAGEGEAAGMGHPGDWLAADESVSIGSLEAEQLLADLRVLVGRCMGGGGQTVVLESISVKHALHKRYFDPWKKAEEDASKPSVPGTKPKAPAVHHHSIAPANSYQAGKSHAPPPPPQKGIRARKGLKGVNALVQGRLKELFENVVEAFVFLDQNGDESITIVELGHGLKRMGITGLDMKALGAAIAADGLVDLYEFLRLYCWEEIPNVEKALKVARPRHRQIVEEANEKRKKLPDVVAPPRQGASIPSSSASNASAPTKPPASAASKPAAGAAQKKKSTMPSRGAAAVGRDAPQMNGITEEQEQQASPAAGLHLDLPPALPEAARILSTYTRGEGRGGGRHGGRGC